MGERYLRGKGAALYATSILYLVGHVKFGTDIFGINVFGINIYGINICGINIISGTD